MNHSSIFIIPNMLLKLFTSQSAFSAFRFANCHECESFFILNNNGAPDCPIHSSIKRLNLLEGEGTAIDAVNIGWQKVDRAICPSRVPLMPNGYMREVAA